MNSKKIYLMSGAFVLAIILIAVFALVPLLSSIDQKHRELAEKNREIDSFYSSYQNLETLQNDYSQVQQALKKAEIYLPTGEAIKFIQMIEAVAQQTENRHAISVLKGESQTKNEQLKFQISIDGSFSNLVKFLIYLENAKYFNIVNSLKITQSSQAFSPDAPAASNAINSIITLSAYQK